MTKIEHDRNAISRLSLKGMFTSFQDFAQEFHTERSKEFDYGIRAVAKPQGKGINRIMSMNGTQSEVKQRKDIQDFLDVTGFHVIRWGHYNGYVYADATK
jgi:hypothetical protein